VLIPVHVIFFRVTRRHYAQVSSQLSLQGWTPKEVGHNVVLLPISGLQRAVVGALAYARTLSPDVRAVYVNTDHASATRLEQQWREFGGGTPLVVLDSPYRSLMEPLLDYIDQVRGAAPEAFVTVVLPEFVPARWWHHVFHNQRALLVKGALLFTPNTVVTSVPFHLRE
jgi:hypothetical protein